MPVGARRCRPSRLPSPASRLKMSTEELHAFFGATEVLKGITLAVPDRRVTAIIGPSGCGKSTFIRCLNRMHEVVPGARISRAGAARRRGHLRAWRGSGAGAAAGRDGLPEAEPVPDHVDPGQRPGGAQAQRAPRREPRRAGREGPQTGGALGRGQGRPRARGDQPVGRAAAAALHCQRAWPCRRR